MNKYNVCFEYLQRKTNIIVEAKSRKDARHKAIQIAKTDRGMLNPKVFTMQRLKDNK